MATPKSTHGIPPDAAVEDPLDPHPDAPTHHDPGRGLEDYEDEGDEGESEKQGRVADMLRKAMVAGLGAVFMTEEGIRAQFKDLKLPKEVLGYLVGQAERTKDELLRVVSQELRNFLQSAALRREVLNLLSQLTLEVKAEIRLKPDEKGMPELKVRSATARHVKKKS